MYHVSTYPAMKKELMSVKQIYCQKAHIWRAPLYGTRVTTDHLASEGVARSSRLCVIWPLSLLFFDNVYKVFFFR
jgi:hypothetical protein